MKLTTFTEALDGCCLKSDQTKSYQTKPNHTIPYQTNCKSSLKQPKQVGSWWLFLRRIKINFSPHIPLFYKCPKVSYFLSLSCEVSSFEFTFLLKFLLSIKAEKVTFYSLNSWWILSWCLDAVWIIFKYYRILMRHFFQLLIDLKVWGEIHPSAY